MGEIIGEILKHLMKGWEASLCKESSNPWKFRMPHGGPPATNKGMEIRDAVLTAFRVRVYMPALLLISCEILGKLMSLTPHFLHL